MKKTVSVVMFLALIVCMAACASDIKRTTTADGFSVSRTTVAEATVVEIDHEKHTALLKDKDGMQLINVGPDAPNFGKIQVGDRVIAEVVKSVRVAVEKSADAPGPMCLRPRSEIRTLPARRRLRSLRRASALKKLIMTAGC